MINEKLRPQVQTRVLKCLNSNFCEDECRQTNMKGKGNLPLRFLLVSKSADIIILLTKSQQRHKQSRKGMQRWRTELI